MEEHLLPKQTVRVQFPLPAPRGLLISAQKDGIILDVLMHRGAADMCIPQPEKRQRTSALPYASGNGNIGRVERKSSVGSIPEVEIDKLPTAIEKDCKNGRSKLPK